jgi:hypothetical protein
MPHYKYITAPDGQPIEREPRVEVLPVLVPELRAIDCKTPKDWERWSRERREYEEPYGAIGGRY